MARGQESWNNRECPWKKLDGHGTRERQGKVVCVGATSVGAEHARQVAGRMSWKH